jgi:hypothetical protein
MSIKHPVAKKRARAVYNEMMAILEKHEDDKEVVRYVLAAMFGRYARFMEENAPDSVWAELAKLPQ